MVGTFFLAQDIITIVSGTGFPESVTVLRILVFSLACIFFGHYFNMLLLVGNAQKRLMQTLLLAAAFNLSLNFFLIPRYSYLGSALTAVATELLVVFLTAFLTRRYIRYVPSFESFWKILLSGSAMAIAVFFLEPVSFLLAGFFGVLVYFGVLWMTRAITSDEIRSLFPHKGEEIPDAEYPVA